MKAQGRIIFTLFFLGIITVCVTVCLKKAENQPHLSSNLYEIKNFREIPGITAEEILAIENLQRENRFFLFSMPYHTETFLDINGEFRGFTKLFCDWMTGLFGLNFKIEINDIAPTLAKMRIGEIDFSLLAVSEERLKTFKMTDPIVYRTIKIMRTTDTPSLQEIAKSRKVRFVFMQGANVIDLIDRDSIEAVTANNYHTIYQMLINNEVDAFIANNTAEAAFDIYGGVIIDDFLPLAVNPISLATGKEELEPVISLITKALNSGAYEHLTEMYRQGYQEYLKNKFYLQLTEEEKSYIRNNPVIPFGSQSTSYPLTFYNTNNEKWEGITFDILNELKTITNLDFKIINKTGSQISDVIQLLETGEIYLIPYMIKSSDRIDRFIWAEAEVYTFDKFAMISKQSYPNIEINDIPFKKVGIPRRTAFAQIFREWFPDAMYVTEYDTTDDAFLALDRGEIDLVINTQSRLTALTNYYELSDYKANFLFNHPFEANFAFNKEQVHLKSIIDKALPLINTDRIAEQWLTRTYNIEAAQLRQQRPWFIGVILLFACIIILIIIQFIKSRKSRNLLKEVVETQTSTINTIFNATPDIIFCKDIESRYTKCNRSMEKHFGLNEKDIIGKNDIEALKIPLDIARGYIEMDKKIINEKRAFVFEELVPSADGTVKIFETTKAPVIQNDEVTGIMAISRDITLRKAAEEKAKAASETKNRFIANISHEIRTPMNSIIGFSEIARDDEIPEKTKEYLDRILESSELLLSIINNILDISKIEAGRMELENISFSLQDILNYCTAAIMPVAEEKGLKLHRFYELPADKKLSGDPVKLRQVLLNLLSNAVKFTNSGIIILSAAVKNTAAHNGKENMTVYFEIKDTGIGMTDEQVLNIFKPFSQADDSITRKYGGTGLGLSITKSLIELMGGNLEVKSAPGTGSKFSFSLSFDILKPEDDTTPQESLIFSNNEKPVFKGDILVFEDNKMNQQVIYDHLVRLGLKTEIAENGQEGLEIIKKRMEENQKSFDLIFMDIHMPVMDGLETASRIIGMGIKTPIIAMTANIMTGDLEVYKEKGMEDNLGKPFTSQELWKCLMKYLPLAGISKKNQSVRIKTGNNDNSGDMEKRFKSYFLKNNQTVYEDIKNAIEENDIAQAHRTAHALKGNAGTIGETRLQEIAANIELMLKENIIPDMQTMETLNNELESVLNKLKNTAGEN